MKAHIIRFYILILTIVSALAIQTGVSARPGPDIFNGGTDDGVNIEITNVNIDNFPNIHIFARVTDNQGFFIPDLGPSNFEVRENGTLVNCNVEANFGYMAVTLVMDQSGSMGGWEQDVIDACTYFIEGLDVLDKGAIVKFATTATVDVPMTYNKDALLNSINGYVTNGLTDLWDAINLGIQECYFEPEKKAVVTFTDGNDNQAGVWAIELPGFAGTDITLYNIGIGNISADSLIYVAEATGGFYMAIDEPSQMGAVLEDIRNDVGNLYDIFYVSPDPEPNGRSRALQVVAEYGGETGWDTISYIAPNSVPPTMTLHPSTAALLGVMQPAGSSLYAACNIVSPTGIDNARIYYKNTNAPYYTQVNLIHGAGNTYYYNIPGTAVTTPGMHFYFQATDNEGNTVTLPGYNPSYLSFAIPIAPNQAPDISYYPPTIWLERRSLEVEMTVEDNTHSVIAVSLFYRVPHTFFYYESQLQDMGDNVYGGIIEGPMLNAEDDMEIFVAAWDDYGVANYWYSSDVPYLLDCVVELGPTPPAVVLEPDNQPIIIPANGGSFDYTMFAINPIPDSAVCDVWADIEYPDGSISETLMEIIDLELSGGETFIDSYTQEVPDTAMPGEYYFMVHTGDLITMETYYTADFEFTKLATVFGPAFYSQGWRNYPAGDNPEPDQDSPRFAEVDKTFIAGSPNPFNASTKLSFYLPQNGRAVVSIHNISGETVQILADDNFSTGLHELVWDASSVSTGIYFCRLVTASSVRTEKILYIK